MDEKPIAYTVPYATYRLTMCLRCAKTYPESQDKQPVTCLVGSTRCDKCRVKIKDTGRG